MALQRRNYFFHADEVIAAEISKASFKDVDVNATKIASAGIMAPWNNLAKFIVRIFANPPNAREPKTACSNFWIELFLACSVTPPRAGEPVTDKPQPKQRKNV